MGSVARATIRSVRATTRTPPARLFVRALFAAMTKAIANTRMEPSAAAQPTTASATFLATTASDKFSAASWAALEPVESTLNLKSNAATHVAAFLVYVPGGNQIG